MNEVVEKIALSTGFSKDEVKVVIKAFLDEVQKGVSLTGYFTSSIVEVPAKSGVTKLGGAEKAWSKPAHKELKIKLAKSYKNL